MRERTATRARNIVILFCLRADLAGSLHASDSTSAGAYFSSSPSDALNVTAIPGAELCSPALHYEQIATIWAFTALPSVRESVEQTQVGVGAYAPSALHDARRATLVGIEISHRIPEPPSEGIVDQKQKFLSVLARQALSESFTEAIRYPLGVHSLCRFDPALHV